MKITAENAEHAEGEKPQRHRGTEKNKAKPGDELRVAAEIVDILGPFSDAEKVRMLRAAAILVGLPDPIPGGEERF